MNKMLYWAILGTRGGLNRAKIIKKINKMPCNAHQLAEELSLSYRTIRHHLKILEDAKIVKPTGERYGKIYFLSEEMEKNYDDFEVIWKQVKGVKDD